METITDRKSKHYELLAGLFNYPDNEFPAEVQKIQEYLDEQYPAAGKKLQEFSTFISTASLTRMEELYTRSFDVQAITTLDIGYVMFGDDYKRGALLVNLNREHKEAGIDCNNELADHLPNVLRLLSALKDQKLVDEIVQRLVGPSIKKMISEFRPEKIIKKNEIYKKHHKTLIDTFENADIYQNTIEALLIVLESDFEIVEIIEPRQTTEFLSNVTSYGDSIGKEIELEP